MPEPSDDQPQGDEPEHAERDPEPGPRAIHERMLAILGEMPAIGKNQRNTQQNFMFRGHDDVLNALNPLLARHGVLVVPDVLERITATRETSGGKAMYEVNLHVRFTFYGPDGDSVVGSTWGEGTDMGDKSTNKAMTMAFKNVLNQAFAISTEEFKDSDGETPQETVVARAAEAGGKPAEAKAKKPTPTQRKQFQGMLDRLAEIDSEKKWLEETIEPWVFQQTNGKGIADLSREGYDLLLRKVEGLLSRAEELVAADVPFSAPPGPEHVEQAAGELGMNDPDLPLTGAEESQEEIDAIPFGE